MTGSKRGGCKYQPFVIAQGLQPAADVAGMVDLAQQARIVGQKRRTHFSDQLFEGIRFNVRAAAEHPIAAELLRTDVAIHQLNAEFQTTQEAETMTRIRTLQMRARTHGTLKEIHCQNNGILKSFTRLVASG